MAQKPRDKRPASATDKSEGGRLAVDDRGNVTWEWKDEGDLLADDTLGTAERLSALVDPNLQVADDDDDPMSSIKSNPKGLKKGYNPYNSGVLGTERRKKKKNLRELSKWVELRKKMAEKKPDEE
jgi:hypothetical protein